MKPAVEWGCWRFYRPVDDIPAGTFECVFGDHVLCRGRWSIAAAPGTEVPILELMVEAGAQHPAEVENAKRNVYRRLGAEGYRTMRGDVYVASGGKHVALLSRSS